MRGGAFTALIGSMLALVGALGFELRALSIDDPEAIRAPAPLPTPSRPVARPAILQREAQGKALAQILARPLFSPSRRPAAGPVAIAAPAAVLPRLAGTIVHRNDRSVIFVLAGGGKPVVAHEGAEVGGYVVQAIQAGSVTMSGPDGDHVLRPTFDPQARASASPTLPAVGTPALPPGAGGPAALNLQGPRGSIGYAGLSTPPQASSAR